MTPTIVYGGLLLARLGAFVAVMPLFGARTPRLVRVGFVIALAAFYLSTDPPKSEAGARGLIEVESLRYALALAREILIGAAMGFAFGLFLLPARVAGEFVTTQIGLNIAPQPGPTGDEAAGALTTVFETVAGLVFLTANGHHVVIAALHASFALYPLGGSEVPQAGPMVNGLATAYEMGVLLAAPLAACLFLLAVTLAIMARTAPQLSIYSVGFTLQVLVVLFGGLFLLPEMVLTMHAIIGRGSGRRCRCEVFVVRSDCSDPLQRVRPCGCGAFSVLKAARLQRRPAGAGHYEQQPTCAVVVRSRFSKRRAGHHEQQPTDNAWPKKSIRNRRPKTRHRAGARRRAGRDRCRSAPSWSGASSCSRA